MRARCPHNAHMCLTAQGGSVLNPRIGGRVRRLIGGAPDVAGSWACCPVSPFQGPSGRTRQPSRWRATPSGAGLPLAERQLASRKSGSTVPGHLQGLAW